MIKSQQQFLLAIARIEKFSPAPAILARAMKLLRDPQSDITDIAALVSSDPGLTADLIRCANSAYYGASEPAQTIGEALQKIGFRETIHLLNLAVARLASGRDLGSYGIAAADFWSESLFNGLFLRNLATATAGADPDEAYTAGLLRFIGRLAINQAISDLGCGLYWLGAEPIAQWELDNVGFVQAQAGAILMAKWQFPPELVQAIAGQDASTELRERNWLAEALRFSTELLPQGLGEPFPTALAAATPPSLVDNEFMQRNTLSPSDVWALVANTHEDYNKIRQNLGG